MKFGLRRLAPLGLGLAMVASLAAPAGSLAAGIHPFDHDHGGRHAQTPFLNLLGTTPSLVASTVPDNGDGNPYGVTVVPADVRANGMLAAGDILVSNFNSSTGQQGTGSTIILVQPTNGMTSTFYSAGSPIGFSTALMALRSGIVVAGTTPADYSSGTPVVGNGELLFLDGGGNVLLTLTDSALLRGVWDMTANDTDQWNPQLFVSNVLNGTVVRVNIHVTLTSGGQYGVTVESITTIGSGFPFRTDPAALVIGPTGLAWDNHEDVLFVADTAGNRIAYLTHASRTDQDEGKGHTVFSGKPLQGPLGLLITPQNTLLTVNGDAVGSGVPVNSAVEIGGNGHVVATRQFDNGTPGALFGITLTTVNHKPALVYVEDNTNTVDVQPEK